MLQKKSGGEKPRRHGRQLIVSGSAPVNANAPAA